MSSSDSEDICPSASECFQDVGTTRECQYVIQPSKYLKLTVDIFHIFMVLKDISKESPFCFHMGLQIHAQENLEINTRY